MTTGHHRTTILVVVCLLADYAFAILQTLCKKSIYNSLHSGHIESAGKCEDDLLELDNVQRLCSVL